MVGIETISGWMKVDEVQMSPFGDRHLEIVLVETEYPLDRKTPLKFSSCRIAVSPHEDTASTEPCVRLSPHTALPLSLACKTL